MTKSGKSNFGKYFRYKLNKTKPIIFFFALINLFTAVILHVILYKNNNYVTVTDRAGNSEVFLYQTLSGGAFYFFVLMTIISTIMITVTTIKSMKSCYDRAAMDTLGCLPLSYGERFWGDLLSSMFANYISLIPSLGISLIIENNINAKIVRNFAAYDHNSIGIVMTHTVTVFLLAMMISYIGAYAVTSFICSCCGKFGAAVVFSLLTTVAVPGIFTVYTNHFFSYSIGFNPFWEVCSKIGMLLPFGTVFSILMRQMDMMITLEERNNFDYLVNRPACFIIPILLAAAFFIGAYYIGKRRKAEKTGESFVFKNAFYVLLITLLVMVVGVLSSYFSGERKAVGLIIITLLTFLLYFALEYTQNRSFKGSWKTVLRFAATYGVCAAFLTLVRTTNAFGIYKNLPGESSINEIRVSGEYFFSDYGEPNNTEHIYKSGDSVSAILSEHKKLLESDDLITGNKLSITYVTKSGKEIQRKYTVKGEDSPIKSFSSAVNDLQEFDPSILGVVGGSDLSGMTADFNPFTINGVNLYNLPEGTVRSDRLEELAEILRNDINQYYFDDNRTGQRTVGMVMFYDLNKKDRVLNRYRILDVYVNTLEFLNDRANFVDLLDDTPAVSYHIIYTAGDSGFEGLLGDLGLTVYKDDESEYAKELLSYIEVIDGIYIDSPCFTIYDNKRKSCYGIRQENEKAAVKAMLGLFREKYAQ